MGAPDSTPVRDETAFLHEEMARYLSLLRCVVSHFGMPAWLHLGSAKLSKSILRCMHVRQKTDEKFPNERPESESLTSKAHLFRSLTIFDLCAGPDIESGVDLSTTAGAHRLSLWRDRFRNNTRATRTTGTSAPIQLPVGDRLADCAEPEFCGLDLRGGQSQKPGKIIKGFCYK